MVYAPEWPGYGAEASETAIEDMLDFALHGWDIATALELERPHLVAEAGHMLPYEQPGATAAAVDQFL